MHTITLGVEDAYETYDFYTKDKNFELEKQRINNKFKNAIQLGINIVKQQVTCEFIKMELLKKCVCILLVDANKLKDATYLDNDDSSSSLTSSDDNDNDCNKISCCLFRQSKTASESNANFVSNSNYLGHFIVVIGFDEIKNIIYFR